ncbi:hypothetical protein Fmac_013012 [Flemingia macrophylla]|uniref:Secreted protein n=1 Tax=Flemingia macrophylla TaxID=520843 RepID=A0ABD1MSD9_9FABA
MRCAVIFVSSSITAIFWVGGARMTRTSGGMSEIGIRITLSHSTGRWIWIDLSSCKAYTVVAVAGQWWVRKKYNLCLPLPTLV